MFTYNFNLQFNMFQASPPALIKQVSPFLYTQFLTQPQFNTCNQRFVIIILRMFIHNYIFLIILSTIASLTRQNILQIPEIIRLEKSPNDYRKFQAMVLKNGIKLILIEDEKVLKSAFAVSVFAGSLSNPPHAEGIAHFLEHMLFMGSQKYPIQNEYFAFVRQNSGTMNAGTYLIDTTYYLQVTNNVIFEGVDRLSNFFINPLIKENSLQRQRNAVNNQYSLLISNEGWRGTHVLQSLASQPFSMFLAGNNKSLSYATVRDDLLWFFNTYYSSNIMNAVLLSNYSISKMKEVVIPVLESIPNRNAVSNQWGQLFTANQRQKFVRIESLKDQQILTIFWITQNLQPYYKQHVEDYISLVFSFKGSNSLIQILKERDYVTQINIDITNIITQTVIQLEIKLTKKGFQNYLSVYNIILDFVSQLKVNQNIYQQIKAKNTLDFQFKQKIRQMDQVLQLSKKMHLYPLNQVANYQSLFLPFEQAKLRIQKIIKDLVVQNSIVFLSAKATLQNALVQRVMGVRYKIQQRMPQRKQTGIKFALFPQNPYLPVSTQQYIFTSKQVQNTENKVYLYLNNEFNDSKGGVQIRIYGQQPLQFIQFYQMYLSELLLNLTYPAQRLITTTTFSSGKDCLIINIIGFSDVISKLVEFLGKQVHKFRKGWGNQVSMNVALQKLKVKYKNAYKQRQDKVADQLFQIIMVNNMKLPEQKLEIVKNYKFNDITQRIKKFWNNNVVRILIVGNFEQKTAKILTQKIFQSFKSCINLPTIPKFRTINLGQSPKPLIYTLYLQSPEFVSSAAQVYYQAGLYTQDLYYRLLLLKNYADQPYFNELRTIKQYAYTLRINIENFRGVLAVKFSLVSSTLHPKRIVIEIKQFLGRFFGQMNQKLKQQNNKLLLKIKKSVFTSIKNRHNNMKQQQQFMSKQVFNRTNYYNRKQDQQINRILNPITAQDMDSVWSNIKNNIAEVHIVAPVHAEAYKKDSGLSFEGQSLQRLREGRLYWRDGFSFEE